MESTKNQQEKVNKLLVKCIELRKKLALSDPEIFVQLESKEVKLKEKLWASYEKLIHGRATVFVDVKLYIEESLFSKGPFNFSCDPEWTVQTAISKIVEKFRRDSSVEDVYILNGKYIANKWVTLRQCHVQQDNDILYVYVAQQKEEETENVSSTENSNSLNHQLELESVNSDSGGIDRSLSSNVSLDNNPPYVQNITVNADTFESISALPASNTSATYIFSQHTTIHVDTNNGENPSIILVPKSPQSTSVDGTISVQPSSPNIVNNDKDIKVPPVGWPCPVCTFINKPTRPGCEMCATDRPVDYLPPDGYVPSLSEQDRMAGEQKSDELMKIAQEEKRKKKESKQKNNYQQHMIAVERNINSSQEVIECSICLVETEPGETVCLADCLHRFCKDCMTHHITLSEDIPVKCPYVDDEYYCQSHLLEREIRSLLSAEQFQHYLSKSLASAEQKVSNSFHCKTADCDGWCVYDDGVNVFKCPACNASNCLTCKAIHENMNCKQYQEQVILKSSTDKQARKTRNMLESLVKSNEAIHCPRCNIIILKKDGCDWLRCTMCGLEICWVTKLPRWGPNGKGDTSGGCHCKENGKKCHKNCVNCH